MQTPAPESCIQDDLVVFPGPQTQERVRLTATHIVEEFVTCAQAGMDDNPADVQLISRICLTVVDLSTWFDQARNMTAEQQGLAALRNLLDLKQDCTRGCLSDVRGRLERELLVPTSPNSRAVVPLLGQQRTTDDC